MDGNHNHGVPMETQSENLDNKRELVEEFLRTRVCTIIYSVEFVREFFSLVAHVFSADSRRFGAFYWRIQ